jgi:hypothetical protein
MSKNDVRRRLVLDVLFAFRHDTPKMLKNVIYSVLNCGATLNVVLTLKCSIAFFVRFNFQRTLGPLKSQVTRWPWATSIHERHETARMISDVSCLSWIISSCRQRHEISGLCKSPGLYLARWLSRLDMQRGAA